jgi:hypothetical protein
MLSGAGRAFKAFYQLSGFHAAEIMRHTPATGESGWRTCISPAPRASASNTASEPPNHEPLNDGRTEKPTCAAAQSA